MLDSEASHQPSKFRTKNWVEIKDESRGTYTGSDIKFKTSMLRSNLCDNADAYILVKEIITITGAGNDDAAKRLDERNKGVIFEKCAPFTKCISRIYNNDIDTNQDIDIIMSMYNLIDIVIIIQKHLDVHDNITKMNQIITFNNNLLNLK